MAVGKCSYLFGAINHRKRLHIVFLCRSMFVNKHRFKTKFKKKLNNINAKTCKDVLKFQNLFDTLPCLSRCRVSKSCLKDFKSQKEVC